MHITQKSAQNIVNEMKASIHRDINIMDENGVILASTDPARRGKLPSGSACHHPRGAGLSDRPAGRAGAWNSKGRQSACDPPGTA